MKKSLLIASTLLFALSSCSSSDSNTDEAVKADSTKVETISVQTFINSPFEKKLLEDKRWQNFISHSPNSQDSSITDSITTLTFGNSIVNFHQGEFVHAEFLDTEFVFVGDIKVGLTRSDFEKRFNNLGSPGSTAVVEVNDTTIYFGREENFQEKWSFHFVEDTLRSIDFEQYHD